MPSVAAEPSPLPWSRNSRARPLTSLVEAVGRTPLLRLRAIEAAEGLGPDIELYAKLEFFNPGGSVKDRAALAIVQAALAGKKLKPGMRLLDSTSGNTGVAYAWIGAALGLPVSLVMPENVSTPRKRLVDAFGAEILYSDPLEGSDGAIRLARDLAINEPARYLYLDQYSNPNNPLAHFNGTGFEIWSALRGRVTHFVAGIGTSGTLMGTGRRLKQENPKIAVVGVQPADSFHGLEGLKHLESSIVPPIFRADEVDRMIFIETEAGWDQSERLARLEGTLVGHSAGAALEGCLRIGRELRQQGRPGVIATVFPDKAERYIEAHGVKGN